MMQQMRQVSNRHVRLVAMDVVPVVFGGGQRSFGVRNEAVAANLVVSSGNTGPGIRRLGLGRVQVEVGAREDGVRDPGG